VPHPPGGDDPASNAIKSDDWDPFALHPSVIEPWVNWSTLPAAQLLPQLSNNLEPAAFSLQPELGRLRQAIEQTISRIVRMSGSGSTLFTLCDTEAEAGALASRISARHSVPAHAVRLCPVLADDLG
jgi:4-diphosphocytidyl-2C-methyl-D-erythritol kinase